MDAVLHILGYGLAAALICIAVVVVFHGLTIFRASITVLNDPNKRLVNLQKAGFDIGALFSGKLKNEGALPISTVGHGISGEIVAPGKVRYDQLETVPGRGA